VSTLTAILTHLDAPQVHERLDLLQAVCGERRFVLVHGGARKEFERVEFEHKLFIDDATLRGPEQHLQSWTQIFENVWRRYFESDATIDSLYFIEYDHLVLDAHFETPLRELALATGADFMGKSCVDRTATNWEHYVRFRRDERLLAHLRRLSVRDDTARIFGCLGDGMWLSRDALRAYVEVGEHPPCYCEAYVPTLLHHLGFRVADIDAHSDLYRHVRWVPTFDVEQALAAVREGAVFIHPVKDPAVVRAVRGSVPGSRPSVGAPDSPPVADLAR
jgi:hypothetical protein